ncbi:MAG: formimidoylglutamase [Oligoflexia bacterium]|nr:formimidoylglutamase [Oligoflexia bacterium]
MSDLDIISWFEKSQDTLFVSKNDKHDLRVSDCTEHFTKTATLNEASVILGYPDEEGIKLNGGRLGAALAPIEIRRVLYKMTQSISSSKTLRLLDLGDLKNTNSLKENHERARKTVSELLKKEARVITLGGGHDYGFSDMAAFCEHTISQGLRPLVLNFDAHLDVRPDTLGFNSGTPFYRLLNEFHKQIDFYEIGIQDWCNSRDHLKWAKEKNAKIITLDDILNSGKSLLEFISAETFKVITPDHRLAVSIDIDGFKSSDAPGASQVFPTGIDANQFLILWQSLISLYKPTVVGIYEVSPPLDSSLKTTQLAALLIHQFLYRSIK